MPIFTPKTGIFRYFSMATFTGRIMPDSIGFVSGGRSLVKGEGRDFSR